MKSMRRENRVWWVLVVVNVYRHRHLMFQSILLCLSLILLINIRHTIQVQGLYVDQNDPHNIRGTDSKDTNHFVAEKSDGGAKELEDDKAKRMEYLVVQEENVGDNSKDGGNREDSKDENEVDINENQVEINENQVEINENQVQNNEKAIVPQNGETGAPKKMHTVVKRITLKKTYPEFGNANRTYQQAPNRLSIWDALNNQSATLGREASLRQLNKGYGRKINVSEFHDPYLPNHMAFSNKKQQQEQCMSRLSDKMISWLMAPMEERSKIASIMEPNPRIKASLDAKDPVRKTNHAVCDYMRKESELEHKTFWDVFSSGIYQEEDLGNITLVAHMGYNRLERLAYLSQIWSGPIAVSMWVPDSKTLEALQVWCKLPLLAKRNNIILNVVLQAGVLYPYNVMRNKAKLGVKTRYVFLTDIDLLPSQDFIATLNKILQNRPLLRKEVLAIASFEALSEDCCNPPKTKADILKLWDAGKITPFFERIYGPAYLPLQFDTWRNATEVYKIKYYNDFEPYVIMDREMVPAYDVTFNAKGLFDKASFILDLYANKFRFYAAPDLFNFHLYHKRSKYSVKNPVGRCARDTKQNLVQALHKMHVKNPIYPAYLWKHLQQKSLVE